MDFVKLALDCGAHKAALAQPKQLRFSESFLAACEQNVCGRYGRNYTCPPHVGGIGALIAKVRACEAAVLWQTVCRLEDSYDYEGMRRGQETHNSITISIAGRARALAPEAFVLGAGGCFLCKTCGAVTGEPCRFPGEAISSLEAHGIDVSSIEAATGMKYVNGINTVTYFSGLFLNAA